MGRKLTLGRLIRFLIIGTLSIGLRYSSQPNELHVTLRTSMQLQTYERQQREKKMQLVKFLLLNTFFVYPSADFQPSSTST